MIVIRVRHGTSLLSQIFFKCFPTNSYCVWKAEQLEYQYSEPIVYQIKFILTNPSNRADSNFQSKCRPGLVTQLNYILVLPEDVVNSPRVVV